MICMNKWTLFKSYSFLLGLLMSLGFIACSSQLKKQTHNTTTMTATTPTTHPQDLDTAVFAAGCFWCTEAVFLQIAGVEQVESGYMGGRISEPSYEAVCTGTTGHAEVCRIVYDAQKVSFQQLLQAFFLAHDPTQLNRQGNDEGTQYRSAIFYKDEQQKALSAAIIKELNAAQVYPNPIVTSLEPMAIFYKAEDYHQNYYAQNKEQPYCRFVIQPKLEKFKKAFK
ncbi:MAG: peptide-methionine (S)-S-oxide reductase MsrA [Bacteroidota bacterium]